MTLEVKGQGHDRPSRWRSHPCRHWGVEVYLLLRTKHRLLKIRTDGSQSRVRELGSIGIFCIFTIILEKGDCLGQNFEHKLRQSVSPHRSWINVTNVTTIISTFSWHNDSFMSFSVVRIVRPIFRSLQLSGSLQPLPAPQTTKFRRYF